MKSNVVARLFVVLLACGSVWAQDPPSQQPVPNPAADAPAEAEQPPVTPPKPVVKSVQTDRSAKSVPTDPSKKSALADRKVQTVPVTRLRENARVTVENYADLAKDATASQPEAVHLAEVAVARHDGPRLEAKEQHAAAVIRKEAERLERLARAERNPGNGFGVERLGCVLKVHQAILACESVLAKSRIGQKQLGHYHGTQNTEHGTRPDPGRGRFGVWPRD